MKRKIPENERRKFRRIGMRVPLSIKLLGGATSPPPINVETDSVSPEGVSIVMKITFKDGHLTVDGGEKPTKLIPYLLLDDKVLELDISLIPKGGSIKGIGKVMWYDRGLRDTSYYVRAGISIERMETEYREKWLEFVRRAA